MYILMYIYTYICFVKDARVKGNTKEDARDEGEDEQKKI